jgi:hypothetical protein
MDDKTGTGPSEVPRPERICLIKAGQYIFFHLKVPFSKLFPWGRN